MKSDIYLKSLSPDELSALQGFWSECPPSGHKGFDAFCRKHGAPEFGHASSLVQFSRRIRARTPKTGPERSAQPGELQDRDLALGIFPAVVENAIRERAKTEDVFAYAFRTPRTNADGYIYHGYAITDIYGRHLKTFDTFTKHGKGIVDAALHCVAWFDVGVEPRAVTDIGNGTMYFTEEDTLALAEHLDLVDHCNELTDRGETPDDVAALLCLRAGMTPNDLSEWVSERQTPEEDAFCGPC